MKRKKFNKKLVFNKVTVAHIGDNEMGRAKGGLTVEYSKCVPCNDDSWDCGSEDTNTCPCWSDVWTCPVISGCCNTFPPACP